jgi:hypothetical protein
VADVAPAKDGLDTKEYWVEGLGTHSFQLGSIDFVRKEEEEEEAGGEELRWSSLKEGIS